MKRTTKDINKITDTIKNDPNFCCWFTGYFDGEGCFSMFKQNQAGWFSPRITIHARADDGEMMDCIQQKLGGHLTKLKARDNHKPSIGWALTSPLGCLGIIELFKRWPLKSKKKYEYLVWEEAAQMRAAATRSSPPDALRMKCLDDKLRTLKKYKPSPRIDYEVVLCMRKNNAPLHGRDAPADC